MTLQQYGPERLDELALRMLDVASLFRDMANQQRQGDPKAAVGLHDRKLLEWLSSIEVWAEDARGRQQTEVIRKRGAERAQTMARKK
ncbi:MAG: hypothetical protein K8T91_12200 [Planctomycetes bacterium]|nr:hypothetical protein [Planctomycetota bacterium]